MSAEYRALVDKVDAFTQAALSHAREDMHCTRGCDSCCHVWLTLNSVEAAALQQALSLLPAEARARVTARGRAELAREHAGQEPARCAMLEDSGACAVYSARPLVCRTQGHALRYPAGFIPERALRASSAAGAVTYCPLNFVERPPAPADVLDAERVDQILAVVNQRFCQRHGDDPLVRHPIHALAARAD